MLPANVSELNYANTARFLAATDGPSIDKYDKAVAGVAARFNIPIESFYESTSEFNPEVLKTGTREEKNKQLVNWVSGKNSSVFVKWIPDEFLPRDDYEPAARLFGEFGIIDRIEYVPKLNLQGKKKGNMMFVHFKEWYESYFPNNIAYSFPEPYEVEWKFSRKTYQLKCCVNMATIPKIEYNLIQLSSMLDSLNTRVRTEHVGVTLAVDDIVNENYLLRSEIEMIKVENTESAKILDNKFSDLHKENNELRGQIADLTEENIKFRAELESMKTQLLQILSK